MNEFFLCFLFFFIVSRLLSEKHFFFFVIYYFLLKIRRRFDVLSKFRIRTEVSNIAGENRSFKKDMKKKAANAFRSNFSSLRRWN